MTVVGWGFDAHRLTASGQVLLGGVVVSREFGVDATSDGDVVAHAVADAVLGSAAAGDLGTHFPSSDPRWIDADSMEILRTAIHLAGQHGVEVTHVDVTVVAQDIRVAPHREAIRTSLAAVLGLPSGRVSVKATTTDRMGFLGRGEGIAAVAVVTAEAR